MADGLERIAVALERIANAMEADKPLPIAQTCDAHEAARILCTTRKGLYALYERGQLPRSLAPGRRLVFRTADLLRLTEGEALRNRRRRTPFSLP